MKVIKIGIKWHKMQRFKFGIIFCIIKYILSVARVAVFM